MTTNQKDPLELIEGSSMSHKGLERLAKESGIEEENRPRTLHDGDWGSQKEDGSSASRDNSLRTNTPTILHPSAWFSPLVESAKRFVRGIARFSCVSVPLAAADQV